MRYRTKDLLIDGIKAKNIKKKYSISSKKSFGGTSFDNIKKMITKYRKA